MYIRYLTLPDSRSGRLVRIRRGERVQVDLDAGVVGLVSARQADERAGSAVAASGDFHLGARQIELGFVRLGGHVQGDVLDAQQVFAARGARGDGCVCGYVEI